MSSWDVVWIQDLAPPETEAEAAQITRTDDLATQPYLTGVAASDAVAYADTVPGDPEILVKKRRLAAGDADDAGGTDDSLFSFAADEAEGDSMPQVAESFDQEERFEPSTQEFKKLMATPCSAEF